MLQALDDLYWADARGWPPSVVDEQPAERLALLRLAEHHVNAGRRRAAESK